MHFIYIKFNKKFHILKVHKYFFNIRYMYKYIKKPFNIFFQPNDLTYARIGCIIKKKHIKFANQRNFIKRNFVEYFIQNISFFKKYDLIITTNEFSDFQIYFLKKIINEICYLFKN